MEQAEQPRELDDAIFKLLALDEAVSSSLFSTVPEKINSARPYLDEIIIHTCNESWHSELSPEQAAILRYAVYDVAARHGHKKRKLGGYYSNHPLDVAKILANKGAVFLTVIGGLYHDVVEEIVERLLNERRQMLESGTRKELKEGCAVIDEEKYDHYLHEAALSLMQQKHPDRKLSQKEFGCFFRQNAGEIMTSIAQKHGIISSEALDALVRIRAGEVFDSDSREYEEGLIKSIHTELMRDFRTAMASLDIPPENADGITRKLDISVQSLTRRSSELYYETVGRLFPHYGTVLVIKYADRIANTLDMHREKEKKNELFFRMPDSSKEVDTQRDIVYLLANYDALSAEQLKTLETHIRINNQAHQAKKKSKKERLAGKDRLYILYKNIILINQTNVYFANNTVPKLVAELQEELLAYTLAEVVNILEHLISCHAVPPRFSLGRASMIYKQCLEYDERGGFTKTTEPGNNYFDGLVKLIFDQRVRGYTGPLDEMYTSKDKMFAAALGLYKLCEYYMKEPKFYLCGLDEKGVHPMPPAME